MTRRRFGPAVGHGNSQRDLISFPQSRLRWSRSVDCPIVCRCSTDVVRVSFRALSTNEIKQGRRSEYSANVTDFYGTRRGDHEGLKDASRLCHSAKVKIGEGSKPKPQNRCSSPSRTCM